MNSPDQPEGAAPGSLSAIAASLLALVVAQLFADTHPLAALAGMTILYVAIAAWLFVRMRETVARGPAPFAATLRELDEDVGALKDGDG